MVNVTIYSIHGSYGYWIHIRCYYGYLWIPLGFWAPELLSKKATKSSGLDNGRDEFLARGCVQILALINPIVCSWHTLMSWYPTIHALQITGGLQEPRHLGQRWPPKVNQVDQQTLAALKCCDCHKRQGYRLWDLVIVMMITYNKPRMIIINKPGSIYKIL